MNICIIGGGIIGTSSAVRIKRAFPDAKITIISDELSPKTTSDGAAGLWLPFLDPHTPKEKVDRWSSTTFKLCERLWRHQLINGDEEDLTYLAEVKKAVMLLPAIELYDQDKKNTMDAEPAGWSKIVYDFKKLSVVESEKMGYPKNSAGYTFFTYIFEGSKILPPLYAWLKDQKDIVFEKKKVKSIQELVGFDFVINCVGAAAKDLVGDESIKPVSGHLIRIKAPWINMMMAYNMDGPPTYIIPNQDSVVLGCISRFNNWNTEPQPGDHEKILENCAKYLCPSVRDAEIVNDWIGLRPLREGGVRLEMEEMKTQEEKSIKVIHNYGHGGSGLTLFWGCAEDVVKLIKADSIES